jgi:Dyp-type peroxidase family
MTMTLIELDDVQGNILLGYRLPLARYTFLRIGDAESGRRFIDLALSDITTSELWSESKVRSTFNLAFTYHGLEALDVPGRSLGSFPSEFREGMQRRADLLGDRGPSAPDRWDPIWRSGGVHVWTAIHAINQQALDERAAWLDSCLKGGGNVEVVSVQNAAALVIDGARSPKEHFGYTDGYGNPVIDGAPDRKRSIVGRGKLVGTEWKPVATGEFLFGYRDEGEEVPPAPVPAVLSRNGTFLVYRKLHQNVGRFRRFLREVGAAYAGGPAMLAAKIAGRWSDGTPLSLSPDHPDPSLAADVDRASTFQYGDDPLGVKCPLGAHMRRMNPRDALGFDGKLTNRHRILRRGLPYGEHVPESLPGDDTGEHGIVFMAINASIERQFEFVQRQWVSHGNDFFQGDDPDPLIGYHDGTHKAIIQGDPADPVARPPFVCTQLPQFVETRGGEYFFVPSLTALRLIAKGFDAEWR